MSHQTDHVVQGAEMVDRWGFRAALCALMVLGAGLAQAQPNPGQFGREHERPRQAEPPRAPPPRPDMRVEMRPQMRPQMPPPIRPEMRPAMAPFRQPPAPFYAPPPFAGRPPGLLYDPRFGGNGWSNGDGGPPEWDVGAAQDSFNQIVLELQQEHNEAVVALQQQFNAGQISRAQMDFGIDQLGHRYDEAVAYQQQLLFR